MEEQKGRIHFSFSAKLFLLMVIIFVIPLIFLQLMSYSTINRASREKSQELCERNADTESITLTTAFSKYQIVANTILTNQEILKNINYMNNWDSRNYSLAEVRIREEMYSVLDLYPDVLGACLVSSQGGYVFYDKISYSNVESLLLDGYNPRYAEMYSKAIDSEEMICVQTEKRRQEGFGDRYVLTLAQSIQDTANVKNDKIGVLLLYIDEMAIAAQLNARGGLKDMLSFVVNTEGNVVISTNLQAIGKMIGGEEKWDSADALDFAGRYITMGNHSVFTVRDFADDRLTLYNFMNADLTGDATKRAAVVTVICACILITVSVNIAFLYSRKIGRSVQNILSAMNEANRGNLDVRSQVRDSNEFGIISDYLNHMLGEIKKLMTQSSEAKDKQRVAEIQALEAQINPHFMFNTLDSINWLAIENGQYEISQMIKSLSTLFRYSVRNSNEIVTVKTEIEHLKQYIYLQQRRYSFGFVARIHMDAAVQSCKIHKLLLQPLVENSLLHGFDFTDQASKNENIIEIAIKKREDEKLVLKVRDNGKGMNQELMNQLNEYNYDSRSAGTSIGVRNVIARVHMYYDDGGFVDFSRPEEGGLEVSVVIPLVEEE